MPSYRSLPRRNSGLFSQFFAGLGAPAAPLGDSPCPPDRTALIRPINEIAVIFPHAHRHYRCTIRLGAIGIADGAFLKLGDSLFGRLMKYAAGRALSAAFG